MTDETRKEIVEHAVRWANIILTEVLSNHSHCVTHRARHNLNQAVSYLCKAHDDLRFPIQIEKAPK